MARMTNRQRDEAMKVSATEAKNRLGHVLEQAQRSPVFIEKAGRPHSVVLSSERYLQLVGAGAGEKGASLAEQRRRFNEQHKEWITELNERHRVHGSWNDEFRRW